MPNSPFPGMDPYLEAPTIWADVHSRLMNVIAEQLAPQLEPKYLAELDTQVVIEQFDDDADIPANGNGKRESRTTKQRLVAEPDVAITTGIHGASSGKAAETVASTPLRMKVPILLERQQLTVRIVRRQDERLVCAVELLSPVNKRPGSERQKYLDKRNRYLEANAHLVELDLLRRWERMPLTGKLPACDYVAMVSNFYERPDVDVWAFTIRDLLPILPIPLLQPDPPAMLDLGAALRTIYERARYHLRINYHHPPVPPLAEADRQWVADLIKSEP